MRDTPSSTNGAFDVPIIDLLVGLYPPERGPTVPIPREAFRDDASLGAWPGVGTVEYLFPGVADRANIATDAGRLIEEFDRWNIRTGLVMTTVDDAETIFAMTEPYGDRFVIAVRIDPHRGMRSVRDLERLSAHPQVRLCSMSPHMTYPTIAPNSKEYYPIYAKCIELGLPVFINVGFPGPRVPAASQDPMALDEVCWFFPELVVIMKHGGEPWADVCVKLMLRWPNLYYATSAFAPKHYPKDVIEYLNTRGQEKVMFAGYWPNLPYERLVAELRQLPLRDDVWPMFLAENAARVLGLR